MGVKNFGWELAGKIGKESLREASKSLGWSMDEGFSSIPQHWERPLATPASGPTPKMAASCLLHRPLQPGPTLRYGTERGGNNVSAGVHSFFFF